MHSFQPDPIRPIRNQTAAESNLWRTRVFLLAFHIVTISLLCLGVATVAYNMGARAGEKRTKRALARQEEAGKSA